MAFELLDNITSADVAFSASGANLEELFHAAATAVISIMLEDLGGVNRKTRKKFCVDAPELDLLLYAFLSEILFYKDSESLLLLPDIVEIRESAGKIELSCSASGERVDRRRHPLAVDIKAVTMHRLMVEKKPDGWTATVVLDV
jgi:SHS2 domain-containing protein